MDAKTWPFPSGNRNVWLVWLVFGVLALILLASLSFEGLWSPWEFEFLQQSAMRGRISSWLSAHLLASFGPQDWLLRLPMFSFAFMAVVLGATAFRLMYPNKGFGLSVLILATFPQVLFVARHLGSGAQLFAAQACMTLGSVALLHCAVFRLKLFGMLWALLLLLGVGLGVDAAGVLAGVLPTTAALLVYVGHQVYVLPRCLRSRLRVAGVMAAVIWMVGLIAVVMAAIRDASDGSVWLGGQPSALKPISFAKLLETTFYVLAPWSVLMLFAVASGMRTDVQRTPRAMRIWLMCIVWCSGGYLAQSIYVSRYGTMGFPAALGAGLLVLWFVHERGFKEAWLSFIAACFCLLILWRDSRVFPEHLVQAGIGRVFTEVPDVVNLSTTTTLAVALVVLAMALWLPAKEPASGLKLGGTDESEPVMEPGRTMDWARFVSSIVAYWRRSRSSKLLVITLGLLVVAMMALGVFALFWSSGPWLIRRLLMLLVATPLWIILFRLGWYSLVVMHGKVRRFRQWGWVLVAAGGCLFSIGLTVQGANLFGPRDAFVELQRYRNDGEPIARHLVDDVAPKFYLGTSTPELVQLRQAVDFLNQPTRRWVITSADQIAAMNSLFRSRTSRSLSLLGGEQFGISVATNVEIQGVHDWLDEILPKQMPRFQHSVGQKFGRYIELLGYSVFPLRGAVPTPGGLVAIRWVFRVLSKIGTDYEMFVHIEGAGARLNGDHVPTQGRYTTKQWNKGDIIVDEQQMFIPWHYPTGSYTIWIGFFAGDQRLKVLGTSDDRARVGTLLLQ